MPYTAHVTHDIDFITKFKTVRNIVGAIKRGNGFFTSFNNYFVSKSNRKLDPYYNMEEMLEINNSFGIPTVFYFMAGKSNSMFDLNDYTVQDADVKDTLQSLIKNNAIIGLHPSYESFNNIEIIIDEKNKLEDAIGLEVTHTRQHYLRHDINTFQLLLKAGLKFDSTIGPERKISFDENYNVDYVIAQKGNDKLYEQPFFLMDTHLIHNPESMLRTLEEKTAVLKSNSGTARILWHNNNFDSDEKKELYRNVLQIIAP